MFLCFFMLSQTNEVNFGSSQFHEVKTNLFRKRNAQFHENTFSVADTRHTMNMVIRPINDPGMYISNVFLIGKDRELSFAGKLFLEEIGVLK